MSLPKARLGNSDMEITRVGFGSWGISGPGWRYAWGPQDDEESIATIRHAVEQGVNWIDTAAVYGLGHSEEVVAKALADLPEADRPFVFTKLGLAWDENDPASPPVRDMSPASVRREVEASLRRLNVERIDLYQVHWPAEDGGPLEYGAETEVTSADRVPGTPLEEYWQVMADLKAEGKVREIGLSNHEVPRLERAERIAHVASLQPPFSAVNRSAADEIAWSRRNDTGVIVYSPMQSGLLTGAFSRERVAALPEGDWRSGHPDFTTGLDANLAVADALRPIAARHNVSVAAVAVAWTLAWPGVTGAIVGARRPGQVDGWLPAATLELTVADLDEIAQSIERSGAGEGPARA